MPDEFLEMESALVAQLLHDLQKRRDQLSIHSPIYVAVCRISSLAMEILATRNQQDYQPEDQVRLLTRWARVYTQVIIQARSSVRSVLEVALESYDESVDPPLSEQEILNRTEDIASSVPREVIRNLPNDSTAREMLSPETLAPWEPPTVFNTTADSYWDHEYARDNIMRVEDSLFPVHYPGEEAFRRMRQMRLLEQRMPHLDQEVPVNLTEIPRPEDAPPTYDLSLTHPILEGPDGHHPHPSEVPLAEEIREPPLYQPIHMEVDHIHIFPDGSMSLEGMRITIPHDCPSELVQGELITAISRLFNGSRPVAPEPRDSQPGPSRRRRSSSSSSDSF